MSPDDKISQALLADLVNTKVGVPVFADRVEVFFAVVPFCTTEKESNDGENDKLSWSDSNLAITGGEEKPKTSVVKNIATKDAKSFVIIRVGIIGT